MKQLIVLFIFVFLAKVTIAQKIDTVQLFRQFIAISKKYQTPPLQANIIHLKTNNTLASKADTVISEGKFIIPNTTNSYVDFGNMEQIVADSIVVMVARDMKRIVVIKGSKEQMQRQMIKLGVTNYPDSVYKSFPKVYTIKQEDNNKDLATMTLNSKQVITSGISNQSVVLQYNKETTEPVKVVTTRRSLAKFVNGVDSVNAEKSRQVVTIEGKGKYWVYEEKDIIEFNNIQHNIDMKLPYKTADRVVETSNGYKPALGFEGYTITQR